MSVKRGFKHLVGETVVWVDTTAINVVHIHCASGKVISVDSETHHYGFAVISANFDWAESVKDGKE